MPHIRAESSAALSGFSAVLGRVAMDWIVLRPWAPQGIEGGVRALRKAASAAGYRGFHLHFDLTGDARVGRAGRISSAIHGIH
jgi:hypothetical protein